MVIDSNDRLRRATLADFFRFIGENRPVVTDHDDRVFNGEHPNEEPSSATPTVDVQSTSEKMDVDTGGVNPAPADSKSSSSRKSPADGKGKGKGNLKGKAKAKDPCTTRRVLNFLDIPLDGAVICSPKTIS